MLSTKKMRFLAEKVDSDDDSDSDSDERIDSKKTVVVVQVPRLLTILRDKIEEFKD